MSLVIWGVALAVYGLFLAWYVNWRGPVSKAEVETLMTALEAATHENDRNDMSIMRKFLETDDGHEFFMVNLVKLAPGKVPDPITGELKSSREVMDGYTKVFFPAIFARASHPAVMARKVGGYFDAWGTEPDPSWSAMGYMRYRSRRDIALLVTDPKFGGAHDFKFAAMPNTFSFPTQPMLLALISPRLWVGLVIALVAALTQIAVLLAAA
jgi:hypothetical protein